MSSKGRNLPAKERRLTTTAFKWCDFPFDKSFVKWPQMSTEMYEMLFLTMPVLIGYFKVTWYLTIKLFSSISLNIWRHKVTFRRSPNFDCSLWYISLNLSSLRWWCCRTRTNSYQNTISDLKPSRMLPLFALWSMLVALGWPFVRGW